ncbi:protein Tho1p [[Candida] anglica]
MAEYASQTVAQLKELLKAKGLATDGKKADLVQRLTDAESSAAPVAAEQTESIAEPVAAPEVAPVEASAAATTAETAAAEPVAADAAAAPATGSAAPATDAAPVTETAPEPQKVKVLTADERKQLAVELITKKIQRAEKFGDEKAAQDAKKDLSRVQKFGVELGTALANEIGLVDKSLGNGHGRVGKKNFKRGKNSKPRHKKKN